MPPGSTLWLLLHELRLSYRAVALQKGGRLRLVILGAALVAFTVFGGVPLAKVLAPARITPSPLLLMSFDLAIVVTFTLILSQTLSSAVSSFYERGDLDLLLSSPLPPRRVLTVKAVGVATTPFLWFALFLTPVVVPLALLGQPQWLADYAILAAIALLAAAAGLSLAMALFRSIGARRTKTVGQLLAAVIGATIFLISQSRYLMHDNGAHLLGGVGRWAMSGVFASNAPLAWPARAVMGEPLPLLVFAAVSLAIFGSVTVGLGRRFAGDAAAAAGASVQTPKASNRAVTAKSFGGGVFSTLVRKELRLLIRDPMLLSQVLLRTLYVVPLTFVMIKSGAHDPATGLVSQIRLASLAGAITFMAGQVAGSLAWITISAEDAPELLACAPVDGALVRRAKLTATMIPVAVLLTLPLLVLIWLSPWAGACAAFGVAASAVSSGLVNLWFEKPAPRKAFRNRRGGSVVGAIAEIVLGLGWAATTGIAAAGQPWALASAGLTLVIMGVLYGVSNPDRAY
jgi:ABC-2 type transport system permease protein